MSKVDKLVDELVQHQRLWYYRARAELERVMKEKTN